MLPQHVFYVLWYVNYAGSEWLRKFMILENVGAILRKNMRPLMEWLMEAPKLSISPFVLFSMPGSEVQRIQDDLGHGEWKKHRRPSAELRFNMIQLIVQLSTCITNNQVMRERVFFFLVRDGFQLFKELLRMLLHVWHCLLFVVCGRSRFCPSMRWSCCPPKSGWAKAPVPLCTNGFPSQLTRKAKVVWIWLGTWWFLQWPILRPAPMRFMRSKCPKFDTDLDDLERSLYLLATDQRSNSNRIQAVMLLGQIDEIRNRNLLQHQRCFGDKSLL